MRPYHNLYTPWNWHGWWDFGTGALGDIACHVLHPVIMGLQLGYPTKVQESSTLVLNDCAPTAQIVKMNFPEREKLNYFFHPKVFTSSSIGGMLLVLTIIGTFV